MVGTGRTVQPTFDYFLNSIEVYRFGPVRSYFFLFLKLYPFTVRDVN